MAVQPLATTRRLTDAELVSAQFRYSDPQNSIVALNLGVPDANAHPVIVGYYNETPAGGRKANPDFPFVRCCHCGLRRHWKGHVVRDDRGETYIIGSSVCGREHYGVRWDSAEKAFKAEQQRRSALTRWNNMLKLVASYRTEVTEVLSSPALAAIDLKLGELRRASADGFRKLAQIAATAQAMFEVVEERDYDAERERGDRFDRAMTAYENLPLAERIQRRDDGLKPEQDTTPIYRRRSTPLGHLVGCGFLIDVGDVRKFAIDFRRTLDAVEVLNQSGTDAAKTSELSRLLREMTDGPRALDDALGHAGFVELFFATDNLDRIERWSNGEARFSYRREGLNLVVDDASQGRSVINPLVSVDLPHHPSIRSSRYITEEFLPEMAEAA